MSESFINAQKIFFDLLFAGESHFSEATLPSQIRFHGGSQLFPGRPETFGGRYLNDSWGYVMRARGPKALSNSAAGAARKAYRR